MTPRSRDVDVDVDVDGDGDGSHSDRNINININTNMSRNGGGSGSGQSRGVHAQSLLLQTGRNHTSRRSPINGYSYTYGYEYNGGDGDSWTNAYAAVSPVDQDDDDDDDDDEANVCENMSRNQSIPSASNATTTTVPMSVDANVECHTDLKTDMEAEMDGETALHHVAATSSTTSPSHAHAPTHPSIQQTQVAVLDDMQWEKWGAPSHKEWLHRVAYAWGIDVDLSATPASIKLTSHQDVHLPQFIRVLIGMVNGAATYTRRAKLGLTCLLVTMVMIVILMVSMSSAAGGASGSESGSIHIHDDIGQASTVLVTSPMDTHSEPISPSPVTPPTPPPSPPPSSPPSPSPPPPPPPTPSSPESVSHSSPAAGANPDPNSEHVQPASNPNPNTEADSVTAPAPGPSPVPMPVARAPMDQVNADYVLNPAKYMTHHLAEPMQEQCYVRYKHLGGILPRPRVSEPGRRSLRYFIALNLYNSAGTGVAQAMGSELLRLAYALAERIPNDESVQSDFRQGDPTRPYQVIDATDDSHGAVRINASNVYISVYESGSTDDTPKHLEELSHRLTEYGVPHHIVVNGELTQEPDNVGHRINSLTRIRHAPLQPMYDAALRYDDTDGKEGWRVDRVLFINDVFWCAEDAIRLMDEGDGGSEEDMEADAEEERVIQNLPPTRPSASSRTSNSKGARARARDGLELLDPDQSPTPFVRPSHGSRRGYPDVVCAMDYDGHQQGGIAYYDHWVFRDRGGEHLGQHQFPFFPDSFDRAAYREARRMDVSMCWGGMASIRGDLFWQHRLTLRARTESCAASECGHIDIDVMSLKGTNAWIQQDTMTAVSYHQHHRNQLVHEDWYNIQHRLEHRRRMREKRLKSEISTCLTEDSNQLHCRTCRVATSLVPVAHAPLTKRPRATMEDDPRFALNYQSDCPSQHYPVATYVGNTIFYPPPSFCCGEYGQPDYAVNCHHVVTPRWNEDQKERIWAARFDPFVLVHPYPKWPIQFQ